MKLTWQDIREKKRKELHKGEYKRADYIANFDVEKRVKILMKLVDSNPPGTFEYSITDLTTDWEDTKSVLSVFFYTTYWEPMFLWDEEVKAWVFEEILSNLRENGIDHEKVKGYYRVKITMP